jgi:hypothetical protein
MNDGVEVDNKALQLMRCHVCYPNQIKITNSKTQLRKGIISYFKNNGITSLKKNWMLIMRCLQKSLNKN